MALEIRSRSSYEVLPRVVHFGVAGWASPRGQHHHPWLLPAAGGPECIDCTLVRMQTRVLWWLALGILLAIPAGEGPLWAWPEP